MLLHTPSKFKIFYMTKLLTEVFMIRSCMIWIRSLPVHYSKQMIWVWSRDISLVTTAGCISLQVVTTLMMSDTASITISQRNNSLYRSGNWPLSLCQYVIREKRSTNHLWYILSLASPWTRSFNVYALWQFLEILRLYIKHCTYTSQ